MHHALEIQEILANIFDFCSPQVPSQYSCKRAALDLSSLARTCRTFKDPALDMLWRVITDSSPLARCLPEASHQLSRGNVFAFTRPLTQPEWDTLHGYARRIRIILDFNSGLDWESVATFLNPPTPGPLFPKLRILRCEYTEKAMSLLRLPLPSLVKLKVQFENPHMYQDSLKLLPKISPNIETLFLSVDIALDVHILVHLSRMPALNRLDISLSAISPSSDISLSFSNLHDLKLRSKSLDPVLQMLSHVHLPTITDLTAFIESYPSKQDITSFLAGLPTSNAGHTIERLNLTQSFPFFGDSPRRSPDHPLGFDDFRPCMSFNNIRHIELNTRCNVDLTDRQLLTLASAWPRLERLLINEGWGWNSKGGITPGGLVQLLQTCRSLSHISLCVDTTGYTEVPPSHTLVSLGLTSRPVLSINVADSTIEAESTLALATFFSRIAACCDDFSLRAWSGAPMMWFPNMAHYMQRWFKVRDRVNEALGRCRRPESDTAYVSVGKNGYSSWHQAVQC